MCAAPMLTTLATFNNTNGANPYAGLTSDAAGNLYGTTYQGGASNLGTVFKVAANTHVLTTLATFNNTNGASPYAGLVVDNVGNLFGATYHGGSGGLGTIFQVSAGTRVLSTLVTFNGNNGALPLGGLFADGTGNLYGTTSGGGTLGIGTVFQLTAGTHALTTLVSLASFTGPSGPSGRLTGDASGNLYGTSEGGGAGFPGAVFKVAGGTNTLTTLATFNGTNGADPQSSLIADAVGNLYGVAQLGGTGNFGTVFQVAVDTHAVTTLVTFNKANGATPIGGLIVDGAGNLYGTTNGGGANGIGTVFKIAAGTNVLTTLMSFDATAGYAPDGDLIADATGNLYGTTYLGGPSNQGTVFELTGTGFVVPEPATFSLLAFTALPLLRRRRRVAT